MKRKQIGRATVAQQSTQRLNADSELTITKLSAAVLVVAVVVAGDRFSDVGDHDDDVFVVDNW